MPQAQLPEVARRVVKVDEEGFRGFIEELLQRAVDKRKIDLGFGAYIALGSLDRGIRATYSVVTTIPYCRERFGSDTSILNINIVESDVLGLGVYCSTSKELSTYMGAFPFAVLYDTTVYTHPFTIYGFYTYLYNTLGIGARPLLDLAKQAEQAGDKGMAGVLRRVYAILEASKDIIEEIEQADYSRAAEKEIREKAEEVVKLLREAKRAAQKGDTGRLSRLLDREVLRIEGHMVTLGDIVDYLIGKGNEKVKRLHRILLYYSAWGDTAAWLKDIDIYDTIITVAEHFGLEVRR